jgi:hypothetical protein
LIHQIPWKLSGQHLRYAMELPCASGTVLAKRTTLLVAIGGLLISAASVS